MSFARTGSQAGSVGTALAVGRLVISRMIPGSLHRPLSHSAFVEVTLMPLRLRESNFAAWDRERPPWPSVFAEGVKVIKSKGEWACAVFCGESAPTLCGLAFHILIHACWLFVCLFVCLLACFPLCCSLLVLSVFLFVHYQLFLLLLVMMIMLLSV